VVSTQIFTPWADIPIIAPSARKLIWLNSMPSASTATPPTARQVVIQASLPIRRTTGGVTTAARPKPTAEVITSRAA
jgi:hypothetical protein